MNQNPLEQQQVRINALRQEARRRLGGMFDKKDKLNNSMEVLVGEIEFLEKCGLVLDKEAVFRQLKESVNIKDREIFIRHLLKVLDPAIVFKITHSKIIDKKQRERTMDNPKNQKLSEVLYINSENLNLGNDMIFFHLTHSRDLMTKEGIEFFKQEIEKGLIKLAELIKPFPNIEKVMASSWILATARGRKRVEDLGFTFIGELGEDEMAEFAPEEHRKFAQAFMKREDFLSRYGGSK